MSENIQLSDQTTLSHELESIRHAQATLEARFFMEINTIREAQSALEAQLLELSQRLSIILPVSQRTDPVSNAVSPDDPNYDYWVYLTNKYK